MKMSRFGPVVACVFLAGATFGGAAHVAGAGQRAATMLHATQVMNFFPSLNWAVSTPPSYSRPTTSTTST